jgi:hypothetical protein
VPDRLYAAAIRRGTRALDLVWPAPRLPRLARPDWQAAGPLDLVLSFGNAVEPGDLPPARLGIWRFRIGGRPPEAEALPGQAEVAGQCPSVRIELVAETEAGTRVLHRAILPMRRTHARLLDALAEAASTLCIGACRRAARDAWPVASQPACIEAPAGGAVAAAAGQLRGLAARIGQLFLRDEWRIGLVEATPEALLAGAPLPPPRWLPTPPRGSFHADPFPLLVNGRAWLLFEMYAEAEGRGWIAATPLDAAGAATGLAAEAMTGAPVALDLGCHMSYPSVFQFEGATYCAPETAAAGGLRLFRMGATPRDWTEVAHWPPEGQLADPTLFEHAGRWWLFATPHGPAAGTDLHLWHAATPFGPWTAHPLNPVISDVRAARPAGAVFAVGDSLVRPAQDGAGAYGRAVVLHRILRLDPDGYDEMAVARIEAGRDWPARDGLHTLNWLEGRAVIDAKRQVPDAMAPARMLLRRLRRSIAWRSVGRHAGIRPGANARPLEQASDGGNRTG